MSQITGCSVLELETMPIERLRFWYKQVLSYQEAQNHATEKQRKEYERKARANRRK